MKQNKRFRLKTTTPDFLTVHEAAEYLQVHDSTIRRYLRFNGLPYLKPAGRYMIPRKEFLEWVTRNNAYENAEADS